MNSGLRDAIDLMEAERNCEALQEHFNDADAAGDVAAMEYADGALGRAGCYD